MDSHIDRISQLPDSLLYEILNYLSTKHIVATCILSTRWNRLTHFAVPPVKLVLDDSQLLHPENEESDSISVTFMHFVDKLFDEMLVNKFSVPNVTIRCRKQYNDAKFVSWVDSAIKMNVERLLVNFGLSDSESLFRKLNGWNTLTRLELGERIILCVPYRFSLPNLKSLRLCGVVFGEEGDEEMQKLIYGCPVLLDLHLCNCDFRHLVGIWIQSVSLKNLFIENSWDESSVDATFYTPSLEVLLLKNCLASKFDIFNFDCLDLAVIDVAPFQLMGYDDHGRELGLMDVDEEVGQAPWYDHWVYLVTACFSVSCLYLNHWAIEALHQIDQLPAYQNLTSLSLGCVRETSGWEVLARLLCSAPNLETLALQEGFKKCKDGYTTFERFVSTTPDCLELHLTGFDIMISNEEDEIKLIEYFLKNGKVIETIHVNCLATSNWDGLARLRRLPEGSKIHLLVDWERNAGHLNSQFGSFDW